jgi:hypothetical protein
MLLFRCTSRHRVQGGRHKRHKHRRLQATERAGRERGRHVCAVKEKIVERIEVLVDESGCVAHTRSSVLELIVCLLDAQHLV